MSSSAGSAGEARKMVTLMSRDMQRYELEEAAAAKSEVIQQIMNNCGDEIIPLPNVTGDVLGRVVEYCKKHAETDAQPATAVETKLRLKEELRDWDAKFVDVRQDVLYDLLHAASYLCIDSLLDLAAQKVADMMRGKTPEEIREIFNIENDFTPEEEEEIRRENSWAFQ